MVGIAVGMMACMVAARMLMAVFVVLFVVVIVMVGRVVLGGHCGNYLKSLVLVVEVLGNWFVVDLVVVVVMVVGVVVVHFLLMKFDGVAQTPITKPKIWSENECLLLMRRRNKSFMRTFM